MPRKKKNFFAAFLSHDKYLKLQFKIKKNFWPIRGQNRDMDAAPHTIKKCFIPILLGLTVYKRTKGQNYRHSVSKIQQHCLKLCFPWLSRRVGVELIAKVSLKFKLCELFADAYWPSLYFLPLIQSCRREFTKLSRYSFDAKFSPISPRGSKGMGS